MFGLTNAKRQSVDATLLYLEHLHHAGFLGKVRQLMRRDAHYLVIVDDWRQAQTLADPAAPTTLPETEVLRPDHLPLRQKGPKQLGPSYNDQNWIWSSSWSRVTDRIGLLKQTRQISADEEWVISLLGSNSRGMSPLAMARQLQIRNLDPARCMEILVDLHAAELCKVSNQ